MMLKLLKNDFKEVFFEKVKSSTESIILCAPFVKQSIVREIIKSKNSKARLSLVTYFNLNYYYKGASDLAAIKALINNTNHVYNFNSLHSKIYLFDKRNVIITSANLTSSGFYKNDETGILTDDETVCLGAAEKLKDISIKDNLINIEKVNIVDEIIKNTPKEQRKNSIIENEDIFQNRNYEIDSSLSGWTKEVFLVLKEIEAENFTISDVYRYVEYFKKKYPNNHHIEDKLRQQLQYLRNLGLIDFINRGEYRKLWK